MAQLLSPEDEQLLDNEIADHEFSEDTIELCRYVGQKLGLDVG